MNLNESPIWEERVKCYRGFALILLEEPQINWKESKVFAQLALAMKTINQQTGETVYAMDNAFSNLDIQDLKIEYSKLFIGPFELLAPPYGSVYIDQGHQVMGDSTIKVSKFLQKSGVLINKDFHEPHDHIGLEFEAMSILGEKLLQAVNEKNKKQITVLINKQNDFMQKFLLKTVNGFCEKVISNTIVDFFKLFGVSLQNFISDDARLLNESVSMVDND